MIPLWNQKLSEKTSENDSLSPESLTQTGLDDFDGAVVVLDGLTVLVHVAQRSGDVIVGLSQQTTVGRQVLQLQGKALLEVF